MTDQNDYNRQLIVDGIFRFLPHAMDSNLV